MKFNPKFNLAVEQTRQIQNFIYEYFEAAAFDFPPVFITTAAFCRANLNR